MIVTTIVVISICENRRKSSANCKAVLACGSMVLYLFCMVFFTLRGEKHHTEGGKSARCPGLPVFRQKSGSFLTGIAVILMELILDTINAIAFE